MQTTYWWEAFVLTSWQSLLQALFCTMTHSSMQLQYKGSFIFRFLSILFLTGIYKQHEWKAFQYKSLLNFEPDQLRLLDSHRNWNIIKSISISMNNEKYLHNWRVHRLHIEKSDSKYRPLKMRNTEAVSVPKGFYDVGNWTFLENKSTLWCGSFWWPMCLLLSSGVWCPFCVLLTMSFTVWRWSHCNIMAPV